MRFCASCRRTTALSPQRTAAARAAAWDAFFRQNAELLPTTLPDAYEASSSLLLPDLTALDYTRWERTLEISGQQRRRRERRLCPSCGIPPAAPTLSLSFPRCRADLFHVRRHRGAGLVLHGRSLPACPPPRSVAGQVVVAQQVSCAFGFGGAAQGVVRRQVLSFASSCRPVCRPMVSSSGPKAAVGAAPMRPAGPCRPPAPGRCQAK